MMSSPFHTLAICLGYVYIVKVGARNDDRRAINQELSFFFHLAGCGTKAYGEPKTIPSQKYSHSLQFIPSYL